MTNYCYLNGKVIPVSQAKINVTDMGLLRAYAVFDFMCVYNGRVFLAEEHLDRFEKSAQLLNLKIPLSRKKILFVIEMLLKKSLKKEANIRIVLTGGETFGAKHDTKKRTFFILVEDGFRLPPALYKKGAAVVTLEYERTFPTAKTTNYAAALLDADRRKKEGAVETLYVSGDKVLEATTSNFFIFKGDTLITPKNNVLIGITRNTILHLAKAAFKVEERDIFRSELADADEAFLTATNKEVLPIVKIDTRPVGTGLPGKKTLWIMNAFRDYTKRF